MEWADKVEKLFIADLTKQIMNSLIELLLIRYSISYR